MSLITRETKSRNMYTRQEDEIIVNTWNADDTSIKDVQKALTVAGFQRSAVSIRYRIGKLSKVDSLDAIDYGSGSNQSEQAEAEVADQPNKSRKSKSRSTAAE